MTYSDLVNVIIQYSVKYFKDFLEPLVDKREKLLKDNWFALEFFLDRIYYQARSDDISRKVSERVKGALWELRNQHVTLDRVLSGDVLYLLEKKLSDEIGKGKIGMQRDVEMTISLMKFISKIPDHNLLKYLRDKFKTNRVHELFNELQTIKGIGPKIASFVLRDFAVLFDLDKNLSKNDFMVLQPIDTWVKKVGLLLKLYNSMDVDENTVREAIVDFCLEHSLPPARFNQGMWYFGFSERPKI